MSCNKEDDQENVSSWDASASGWDEDPTVAEYSSKAFASLAEVVDLNDGRRHVLDFGCGTGLLTEKLSPLCSEIVCIDISPKMIEVLEGKKLGNVETMSGDICNLHDEKLNEKFDLVVASSVCAFVPDYEKVMHKLYSCLGNGGQFVQWDWRSEDENGMNASRIEKVLQDSHFQNIKISYPFSFCFNDETMEVIMASAQKIM